MATLTDLEKKKAKLKADFDSAQDGLEKAVKTALAIKDPGKLIDQLKGHVTEALRDAIKAGEAYEDADEKFVKAAKAASK